MEANPAQIVTAQTHPIRVLFVMIHMAMGGSERLVFNLVRGLDRRMFDPSIAWLAPEPPMAEFQRLGVPLHAVRKTARVDFPAMLRLASIIRTHKIDIVNAHHFLSLTYAYPGAKINGTRLVYTEHSQADVLAIPGRWQTIGSRLIRSSDGAIGINAGVSSQLESHLRLERGRVHTIENGVDVDLFDSRQRPRSAVREMLGLNASDVVIGHVANFRRNKNHLFLLRAFREAVQRHPHLKLVLVGKGHAGDPENSEGDVTRFIEESGLGPSVRMLGYRADVEDILAALDMFALVSYKEGLPLSVIEAMASGLPVIGTDCIEAVVEPGVTGLLVQQDDAASLATALGRLASDATLRQRMGEAGRTAARTKYSLGRCVEQTQDLFLSITRSPGPRSRYRQPSEAVVR